MMTAARRCRHGLLAAEILWSYAQVRFALSRYDVRDAVGWLRRHAGPRWPLTGHVADTRLALATIRTLDQLPTDSRCLMRSLVLATLLSRRGAHARVVIGVRGGDAFAAHAWVRDGDRELLDSGGGEFAPLLTV